MPKSAKPAVIENEADKIRAVSQAAARRTSAKKGKGAQIKYYMVVAVCVGVALLAVFLAVSGAPAKKGGVSKMDALVNDGGTVSDVTAKAEGNFTANPSPFFNKWTIGDAKYGLRGITTNSAFLGISGAVQVCASDEGTEGGVIPPSYDARDNWPGCFGDVQDSGNCSSSYAIAAAEVLAARFCIADNAKHADLRLSAQQVLSCDKKSRGCKGGGIDAVWKYIQRRGLYPEKCVPYAGEKGAACKTECKEEDKLKVIDHCVLTNEKAIKREVYNRGPVAAPLYLKNEYLVYGAGVYTPTENAEQLFDTEGKPQMHAVTVLGWGRSQGNPYWLVRHSWGASWGENGYARVAIGSVLHDSYMVTATPATEDNIKDAEVKKVADEKRKEELKVERAARDERIRENRKKYEAEKVVESEDTELKELDDDDFEAEVDLDDSDTV